MTRLPCCLLPSLPSLGQSAGIFSRMRVVICRLVFYLCQQCDSHPAPVSSDTQMSTTLTQHHPCLQQSGALILKCRKKKGVKYFFNIQSQKQTPPLFSLKYPYELFFVISSLCCSMNELRKRLKSLQIHVISGTNFVIDQCHLSFPHGGETQSKTTLFDCRSL